MTSKTFRRTAFACALTVASFGARAWAESTDTKAPSTDKAVSTGKTSATLKASLVDPEKKAKQKAATVKVEVTGVEVIDPALAMEKPKAGQAHLHYQVDDGPVVATTTQKLSFHDLKSGKHTIKVVLAGNDHNPLGPEQTLDVEIP
jgi:hypothetical protein